MATPSRKIEICIGHNSYEVKFPNTGQLLDIELLKIQMSNNQYDTLKFSFNPVFKRQVVTIDCVATFNTLIPKLREDLNVKSMYTLEVEQMSEILKVYEEIFLPWYEEWDSILSNPKKEKDDSEKTT